MQQSRWGIFLWTGRGQGASRLKLVEVPGIFKWLARQNFSYDRQRLDHTFVGFRRINSERLEFMGNKAARDAHVEAAVGELIDQRVILGDIQRMAQRHQRHAGGKPDLFLFRAPMPPE